MVIIRMWLYFPLRWFYGFLLTLVLWIFITIYLGYSFFFFFFYCAGTLSYKYGGSFPLINSPLSLSLFCYFRGISRVITDDYLWPVYWVFWKAVFSCIVVLILVGFYVLPTYHFNFEKDCSTVKQKLNKEYT